jgi:hypothetical protein
VSTTAEDRLAQILHCGYIAAFPTFGTEGPVVCLSQHSNAALQVLLSSGVTARGPYDPWALLINYAPAVLQGALPIWPMDDEQLGATADLPSKLRDRRVRHVVGSVDWSAEREWRICWGLGPAPGAVGLSLVNGTLAGAIVGRPGWNPPYFGSPPHYAYTCHRVPRWLWTGTHIVADGVFDIAEQERRDREEFDSMHAGL